jgi:hypothetical protein
MVLRGETYHGYKANCSEIIRKNIQKLAYLRDSTIWGGGKEERDHMISQNS